MVEGKENLNSSRMLTIITLGMKKSMEGSRGFVAIGLVVILVCTTATAPCLAQDADGLRGLSSISVDFILDADLDRVVDEAEWRTRVERELQRVGITVVTTGSDIARTFLVVAVLALPTTSLGLAYHVQVSIRDVVIRPGADQQRPFYAYTWQTGGIATVARAEAKAHLTSFMTEFLDEFLNAYQVVN